MCSMETTIVSNESTAIRVLFFSLDTLACRVLGGDVQNMPWNGDTKSWRGEAVKLRHTLACRVLGGEV